MPKLKEPYQCDFCSQIKGGNNHWFLIIQGAEYNHRMVNGEFTYPWRAFVLHDWNNELALQKNAIYICSEECAAKALQQWLASTRVPKGSPLPSELPTDASPQGTT